MPETTNVLFKRGQQANLNAAGFTPQDGTFYLTTDTNRLYVGQKDGSKTELKLLNQTVNIIDSFASLPTFAPNDGTHEHDFYYLEAENILAVWTKKKGTGSAGQAYEWVQINQQAEEIRLADNGVALSFTDNQNSTNTIDLNLEITESDNTTTSDSIAIEGTNGITVSSNAANNKLTISGTTYNLTKVDTLNSNNDITSSAISLNDGAQSSTYNLKPGENIRFASVNANTLQISATDTVLDDTNQAQSLTLSAPGTLSLAIEDTSHNSINGSASGLAIKLDNGVNGADYALLTNNSDTTSTAKIYSKAEIDRKFNGLNGMTYKGTIGGAGATVNEVPTTGVHNGDTYVIVQDGLNLNSNSLNNSITGSVTVGDMLIATGTEGNDGVITSNLKWTYIPSGNDSLADVTYSADVDTSDVSIGLVNGSLSQDEIARIKIVGQNGVDVASGAGSTNQKLDVVVSHSTVTTTNNLVNNVAPDYSADPYSFTAITGLTINNGHVTQINKHKFTPLAYKVDSASATSISSNSITSTVGISLVQGANNTINTANIAFTSSSLALNTNSSSSGDDTTQTVSVDMVWGTF